MPGVGIPADDATDLEWLLFTQSGVITWRQAVTLLSPAKVRHLVGSDRWRRVCRGVFVTFTGRPDEFAQRWAAVLAAGDGALLAGLGAARAAGLRLRPQRREAIDILVPASRRAARLLQAMPVDFPAVFVRRTRHLPAQDRQRAHPPRTSLERSLVDAAQWATTDEDARAVLATGCQQRLVAPADLLTVVNRMPRLSRRTLIRSTVLDLAGGPDALSEIDLARLCRRHGLPAPEHQRRRVDASGRVRYVDAYWPRWKLQVEVDGGHHMQVGQWEADMRRQNDIWIAGDRILRFSAFQVRHRPAEVAEQIRRALTVAGYP